MPISIIGRTATAFIVRVSQQRDNRLDSLLGLGHMFERFTESAKKAIYLARSEAAQFGSSTIEPYHILLGLLDSDPPLFTALLRTSPITVGGLRFSIESNHVKMPGTLPLDFPLNNASRRSLAYAAQECEDMRQPRINTAHLLIGLLREDAPAEFSILHRLHITPKAVRQSAAEQ